MKDGNSNKNNTKKLKDSKPKKIKGISRIDSRGTHGWYVRVKKNGKSFAKLFSDSKYNGREHALKCAKKAHAMALETMGTAQSTPSRRLVTTDKRNKSGMVGVNKTFKTNAKGVATEYYQVTWSPAPGKIKNRQWSVHKYGREEAFRLAKNFREQIMISIYGERYTRMVLSAQDQQSILPVDTSSSNASQQATENLQNGEYPEIS
jgi:hypothetical protein